MSIRVALFQRVVEVTIHSYALAAYCKPMDNAYWPHLVVMLRNVFRCNHVF